MSRRNRQEVSSCQMASKLKQNRKRNKSAFYKHSGNFRWKGIKDLPYKMTGNEWTNVIRRVLIGSHGESTKFDVRYFEILPGGRSSLEKHKHEHVVICVRGKGIVKTGGTKREMMFLDTLYIAPEIPHQLTNPYDEPFGFFCIVNSKRDKPVLVRG